MTEQKVQQPVESKSRREKLLEEASGLQGEIQRGMPTATEMRAGAPYMVTRHQGWEKHNKGNILRYLEIRQELPDIPSVEELRTP
jgi:ribosomal protein L20